MVSVISKQPSLRAKRQMLLGLLAGWDALKDDFPDIEDTALEPMEI